MLMMMLTLLLRAGLRRRRRGRRGWQKAGRAGRRNPCRWPRGSGSSPGGGRSVPGPGFTVLRDGRGVKKGTRTCSSTYQLRCWPRFSASEMRWCTRKCQSMCAVFLRRPSSSVLNRLPHCVQGGPSSSWSRGMRCGRKLNDDGRCQSLVSLTPGLSLSLTRHRVHSHLQRGRLELDAVAICRLRLEATQAGQSRDRSGARRRGGRRPGSDQAGLPQHSQQRRGVRRRRCGRWLGRLGRCLRRRRPESCY